MSRYQSQFIRLFAVFIGTCMPIFAGSQIVVGPRTTTYSSEDKNYHRFGPGVSLGYNYNFDAADMFRISVGLDNSVDLWIGVDNSVDGLLTGTNTMVEPGAGLLFTALIPFTVRLNLGGSYNATSYSWTYSDTSHRADSHYSSNKFGFFWSPGLFLQGDVGYIGCLMKNRFYTGKSTSQVVGSNERKTDISSKMWDWGFEGGLNSNRVSHSLSFVFSRTQSSSASSGLWQSWSKIRSTKILSYRIGINIPRLAPLPRLNRSSTAPASLETDPSAAHQEEPTSISSPSLNLRGDIFRPKCESECSAAGKDSAECRQLIEDAWYATVNAKSRYTISATEENRLLYESALQALRVMCPAACE